MRMAIAKRSFLGKPGFQLEGGGGGALEPPKTGVFQEKGSINRTIDQIF